MRRERGVFRRPEKADTLFSGRQVDRTRPIRFAIDGIAIEGFAGDSILSATLASGIDTIGEVGGWPMALDERFCPPVWPRAAAHDLGRALPMDRAPAADGLDLVTAPRTDARPAPRPGLVGALWRLAQGRPRSLGIVLDEAPPLPGPWVDLAVEEETETDLVVVGGGVAGLAAAARAAEAGDRVTVIERRPEPGGDAVFFGAVEGEARPVDVVAGLAAALDAAENATVLTRTDAVSIWAGRVRAHRIVIENGRPVGRMLAIRAPRVVIATGMAERLPVFPGNRLPGVVGARAAFELGARYGVWPGETAAFHTATNAATQVALRAADSGVRVLRLADIRPAPNSRFFDFAKAYGISLAPGLVPLGAAPAPKAGRALEMRFAVALEGRVVEAEPVTAERFVVCGGWQPDLMLWHMAGGETAWDADAARLEARGELDGVVLAGCCAGHRSMTACRDSGAAAADRLFGRDPAAVEEHFAGQSYETADGALGVAPHAAGGHAPAYLDAGTSLAVHAAPARRRILPRWLGGGEDPLPPLIDQPKALSLGDVVAKVVTGEVEPRAAGTVARERCIVAGQIVPDAAVAARRPPEDAQDDGSELPRPPDYLAARFGDDTVVRRLTAADGRMLEPGCLIFANSDTVDPLLARGVVFGAVPGPSPVAVALVDRALIELSEDVVVQDGGAVTATAAAD